MVRWVGSLAEECTGGGVMVCEVNGSGSVWGGEASRRRLRGGGLILSKEDIFRREVQSGRN